MNQQALEPDRFKAETCEPSVATKDEAAEALKHLDEDKAKEFGWESNRNDENPDHLPWPEENESKD